MRWSPNNHSLSGRLGKADESKRVKQMDRMVQARKAAGALEALRPPRLMAWGPSTFMLVIK